MEIIDMPLSRKQQLEALDKGKGFEVDPNNLRQWRNLASLLNVENSNSGKEARYSIKKDVGTGKFFAGRTDK